MPKGVCVVTGASQGIGRACAIAISKARLYDTVVLVARDAANLADTKTTCDEYTPAIVEALDVSDFDGVSELFARIEKDYGPISALVNSAGYADPQPLFNTSMESMKKTFDVNVFGLLACCKEAARYMRPRRSGKIVNMGSTAGSTPRAGWVSYASSKAAVLSISKTLTDELAEYGIKVYSLSPGRCATALRRRLAPEEDQSTIMQPEDVAAVVVTMLSSTGDALDGQDVIVRQQPKLG